MKLSNDGEYLIGRGISFRFGARQKRKLDDSGWVAENLAGKKPATAITKGVLLGPRLLANLKKLERTRGPIEQQPKAVVVFIQSRAQNVQKIN